MVWSALHVCTSTGICSVTDVKNNCNFYVPIMKKLGKNHSHAHENIATSTVVVVLSPAPRPCFPVFFIGRRSLTAIVDTEKSQSSSERECGADEMDGISSLDLVKGAIPSRFSHDSHVASGRALTKGKHDVLVQVTALETFPLRDTAG
jgi:hypothetical protein